ncbi:MAG: hypothetical protein BWY19_00570 [bacterium ADurb.Bin212]|nr:MAG: hypothetical protein BWY19_00570 [bacterium ADurb.Bin212]
MATTKIISTLFVKVSLLFITIALLSSYLLLNRDGNVLNQTQDGFAISQALFYTIMSIPSFLAFVMLFSQSTYRYVYSSALIVGILIETFFFRLFFSSSIVFSGVDAVNLVSALFVLGVICYLCLHKSPTLHQGKNRHEHNHI